MLKERLKCMKANYRNIIQYFTLLILISIVFYALYRGLFYMEFRYIIGITLILLTLEIVKLRLVNKKCRQIVNLQRESYMATLKHDLKVPVLAQIRALELLINGNFGKLKPEQSELLNLTLSSCNYLYNMVSTQINSCKFENKDVILDYATFDLVSVIKDSICEVSYLADGNSTKIIFDNFDKNCFINADENCLKAAITNILTNCIKFAFRASTISVSLEKNGENAELKIKTSGPYINPESIKKLFSKYAVNEEKFNRVGFGLGLYLSKKIITAHRGTLIVESLSEDLNIFGFKIPLNVSGLIGYGIAV